MRRILEKIERFPNVEVEIDIDNDMYKANILDALEFIRDERTSENISFDLRIILPCDYLSEVIEWKSDVDNRVKESKGIYVPVQHQKNDKHSVVKDVIIINCGKLRNERTEIFTSVIVHELNHYLDNREVYEEVLMPNYHLSIENIRNSQRCNQITGLFEVYTEMHSKYLQEKFLISEADKKVDECVLDKIGGADDYYAMAIVIGEFTCWKEMYGDAPEVVALKTLLDNSSIKIWDYLWKSFDKKEMLGICEEVYKGNMVLE